MSKRAAAIILAVLGATACGGGGEEEAAKEAPKGPVLGDLELPVSLRSGDNALDGRKVEVGLAEVRIDDQTVIALDGGKVPAAERSGDELPKVKAALQTPAKSALVLSSHAGIPYETIALILSSASKAGMRDLAIRVRKPGGETATGYLVLKGFSMTPRTDDEVPMPAVESLKWDDMTAQWQAMHDACRTSQTGSCAYVPNEPIKGGKLKIVLHAAGQGVNLDFFRVGLSPEELAAEEKARLASLAAKKEDLIQGRGNAKQTDVAEEMAEGAPAQEALFQFRSQEALQTPSALSETMKPLCGNRACGVVVSADSPTLFVRVASVIGAAFPDGGASPVAAFEMPWTEKPKPPPPPPVAAEPAAAPK